MSHHPSGTGSHPPWQKIVNDSHNENYIYGDGNTISNTFVNNVQNNLVSEAKSDSMPTIEKALGKHHLPGAMFEAQPAGAGCMRGTRVLFLKQVLALLTTRSGPHIAWIAGMAGTGKTSIAITLCRMLWKDVSVILGGSFFCSRSTGTVEHTDVQRIVPTLATVLARQFPNYATALAKQLDKQPDIAHWTVRSQVERLLVMPLTELDSHDAQIVFVIDALDECNDQAKLTELIDALADFTSALPAKFLLTSRPEMYIRRTPISNPNLSSILQLHTVSPTQVTGDIRLYIGETLARSCGATRWYSHYDVEALVQRSNGLFIFVSTALRYILDRSNDDGRSDRLQKIIKVSSGTASTAPLDQIYELVLTEASRPDKVDNDELEDTRRVLAGILTSRASLSTRALAEIIEITPASLRGALDRLHSLVHVPDNDDEPGIRTLHASFGDYMFERAASHIRITAASSHNILAKGCLHRLGWDDLCFNVSRSRSSFEPNPDVAPDRIPLSLLYACLYWAHHLDVARDISSLDEEIGRVLQHKFLFWLEVLSITGNIKLASGLLRIAGSVVKQPIVAQFLRDANSFVASSYHAIARSAPHIYISALPFAAKDSLVHQYFGPQCAGVVAVETFGIDRHGGRTVMTLAGHTSAVTRVAYSRNGHLIASGSDDGTVRVWDTRTGEEIMTPMVVDRIKAIAFVRSNGRVAAVSDNGALYDRCISTGKELLHSLVDHVDSAEFSPDGALLAFGSNRTAFIWRVETQEQLFVHKSDHWAYSWAFAFSFDGRLLAGGTTSDIHLWDNLTAGPVYESRLDTRGLRLTSLSISPDRKALAADLLVDTGTMIQVWNLETPTQAPAVLKYGIGSSYMFPRLAESLAFSPDSSCLAVASYDVTIRFWNWRNQQEVDAPLQGHSSGIKSIVYSPGGFYIASASEDHTLRIWDVGIRREAVQPLPELSHDICVAASDTGALIVFGHKDGSVSFWDSRTGEPRPEKVKVHGGTVIVSAAISSDEVWIAWGSRSYGEWPQTSSGDVVFRLVDAQRGEVVEELSTEYACEVEQLQFSSNALWLAAILTTPIGNRAVHVWDLRTRTHSALYTFNDSNYHPKIAFSPDGCLLALGPNNGRVHIWVVQTGQPHCAPLEVDSMYRSFLRFSRDGTKIVTKGWGGTFYVTSIGSGQPISVQWDSLPDIGQPSWSVSSSERFNAYIMDDGEIWDLAARQMVGAFDGGNRDDLIGITGDEESFVIRKKDTISLWQIEAAFSLATGSQRDRLAQFLREGRIQDGWIKGPSGELLLWVPSEYRDYLQLPPCMVMIAKHRVVITADQNGMHYGDDWTSCWRRDVPS